MTTSFGADIVIEVKYARVDELLERLVPFRWAVDVLHVESLAPLVTIIGRCPLVRQLLHRSQIMSGRHRDVAACHDVSYILLCKSGQSFTKLSSIFELTGLTLLVIRLLQPFCGEHGLGKYCIPALDDQRLT